MVAKELHAHGGKRGEDLGPMNPDVIARFQDAERQEAAERVRIFKKYAKQRKHKRGEERKNASLYQQLACFLFLIIGSTGGLG